MAGQRIERFETVRLTKWGTRVDVALSISPIRDGTGRIVGASKIARDITTIKRVLKERGPGVVEPELAKWVEALPGDADQATG